MFAAMLGAISATDSPTAAHTDRFRLKPGTVSGVSCMSPPSHRERSSQCRPARTGTEGVKSQVAGVPSADDHGGSRVAGTARQVAAWPRACFRPDKRGEQAGEQMKTRAAVLRGIGQDFEVTELDLDGPKAGEVLIRYVAAGLCHSDEHLRSGDLPPRFPIVGGHEGAGIIEEVGPGVTRLKPGDHVICSFLPVCGHCRWCS